jgi:hypothetical protein
MKKIETCVFKENDTFFLDLLKWKSISDIDIEINDIFNFIFENKPYKVKVISITNYEAKLKLI